jgi:CrcB protein
MIWYVAIGGALGSMSRYALGTFIQNRVGMGFPLGTLLINITGSFLLGFFVRLGVSPVEMDAGLFAGMTKEMRVMLTTGFCGGFTTFSAFSYETSTLLQEAQYTRALLYILSSVTLSLVAVLSGYILARYLS